MSGACYTQKHIIIIIIMVRWIALLFLASTVLPPALCCDGLSYYGHLSNKSLSLIKLMGGQLTKQQSPVPFPRKLYRRVHGAEVESQLAFIRDSLKLIKRLWLHLYDHDNLSSVSWDPTHTEHFLMLVHRLHLEVRGCVSKTRQTDSRLLRYYKTLERRTLTRKGSTAEAWELIRRETKLHLEQLHMLATSISCAASEKPC